MLQNASILAIVAVHTAEIEPFKVSLDQHLLGQSFWGSFSAGSKPIFASKYAFCSIFQNLQENHLLASKFCKFLPKNWKILQKFWYFLANFAKFSEIRKIWAKFCRIFCRIFCISTFYGGSFSWSQKHNFNWSSSTQLAQCDETRLKVVCPASRTELSALDASDSLCRTKMFLFSHATAG